MTETTLWLLILSIGLITFVWRISFILLWERITLPPLLTQGLRFAPVAVLSALIVPALLYREGQFDLSPANTRLFAGLIATAVAWYSRNVVLTITVGMLTLWLLQWMGVR